VHSVRFRITSIAVAVVAMALAGGAMVLVTVLHRSLVESIERSASDEAANVAALAEQHVLPLHLPVLHGDALVQVVAAGSGKVVAYTPGVSATRRLVSFAPAAGGEMSRSVSGLPVRDNEAYLVVARSLDVRGQHLVIYAARSLASANATIHTQDVALAIALSALLVLVGLMTWLLTGRTLRPVEGIRAEVAKITAGDLDRRVPVPTSRDEVQRLAVTMNDMLARLEDAVTAQRRFVSDASHELRSPLAGLLAEVEVAEAHPEAADLGELATTVGQEGRRLQRIVSDMLFLARGDERGLARERTPVDLTMLLEVEAARLRGRGRAQVDLWGSGSPSATGDGAAEDTGGGGSGKTGEPGSGSSVPGKGSQRGSMGYPRPAACLVMGDHDELERAVRNLVDNAERFARSRVRLAVHCASGVARVVVEDDGPGVPEGWRESVFERFSRLDESRSRDRGGSGLGLAIVWEIVSSHGGSVWIEDARPGARVVIALPSCT